MHTTMQIENPDEVAVTLKVTMTLGDWRRLQTQLSTDYPAWKLGDAIRGAVTQVQQKIIQPAAEG